MNQPYRLAGKRRLGSTRAGQDGPAGNLNVMRSKQQACYEDNKIVSVRLFGLSRVGALRRSDRPDGTPMLAEEAPNVVTEEGFRLLLDKGYEAQVLCLEDPERRTTQWHGLWAVRGVGPKGQPDCVLVTTRRSIQAREFKTSLGIISFLVQMGYDIVSLPMRKGARALQMRGAHPDRSAPEVESG